MLLALPSPGYCQDDTFSEDWRWAHFTTDNGLPSNRVNDIVETSDGIPWAVTPAGLAWYDGFKWNQLRDTTNALKKRPNWVAADLNGKLIVVVDKRLYTGDQHGFQRVSIPFEGRELEVEGIAPIGNEKYVVASAVSTYLYNAPEHAASRIDMPAPLAQRGPLFFYTGAEGIWINTKNGLYRRDRDRWVLKLKVSN